MNVAKCLKCGEILAFGTIIMHLERCYGIKIQKASDVYLPKPLIKWE